MQLDSADQLPVPVFSLTCKGVITEGNRLYCEKYPIDVKLEHLVQVPEDFMDTIGRGVLQIAHLVQVRPLQDSPYLFECGELLLKGMFDSKHLCYTCMFIDANEERHQDKAEKITMAMINHLSVALFGLGENGNVLFAEGGSAHAVYGSNLKRAVGFHYLRSNPSLELRVLIENCLVRSEITSFVQKCKDCTFHLYMLPMHLKTESFGCCCAVGIYFCSPHNWQELSARIVKEEAVQLIQLKTNFVAMVSHEMQTPLTSIIGMTDLLRDTDLNTEQKDFTLVIHKSAKLLLELINNVLQLTKFEAGFHCQDKVAFNLHTLLDDLLSIVAPLAKARKINIQFYQEFPDDLNVKSDPKCVRQALLNLLSNAIKFSHENSVVELYVTTLGHGVQGRLLVQFEVVDSGIGMNRETLERVFEPFTQGWRIGEEYGGTGLGLSICKKIVDLLEGSIDAISTPGQGSRFIMTLPLDEYSLAIEGTPVEKSEFQLLKPTVSAIVAADGNLLWKPEDKRILVAEDNVTNLNLLIRILQKFGFTKVHPVKNGLEAVETFEKHWRNGTDLFDVLLLDQNMPKLNGNEVAEKVRQLNPIQVIIFVSANVMASQLYSNLADDFVTKPIFIRDLKQKLYKWISVGHARLVAERLETR